jgi:CheY-like chemotaxis protein
MPLGQPRGTVLVVDDDPDICALIEEILTDEGFAVSLLREGGPEMLRVTVAKLEPDCILLDGESPSGYGASWADAAYLAARNRRVPVIMMTGSADAIQEASEATSVQSQAAAFAGVVSKPFELEHLIETVARAVQKEQ